MPPAGGIAGLDRETGSPGRLGGRRCHAFDDGECRSVVPQCHEKLLDIVVGTLDVDEDTVDVVAYRSGQREAGGQVVHERPKTDALHHSFDPHFTPDPLVHPVSFAPAAPACTALVPKGRPRTELSAIKVAWFVVSGARA